MLISYNWLKEYVIFSLSPFQLADRLSLSGSEVEEVVEKSLDIPNVIVGRVISSEKHPNADKLSVCQVDVGEAALTIVCGAPNVAEGQTVAVAKEGAQLPVGIKIQKTKIRGVASEGMICSEQELGLAEESEGIWVLPENLPLGVPLEKALNFEADSILDIALTPNRPDCMSHIGIAREVAALTENEMQKPQIRLQEIAEPASEQIAIEIQTPESCPRYSARVIRNVKVGESPNWLVRRLEAVGMRSINNVVDITNYVLMETGHPLHAFDLEFIKGKKIVVREAAEGEKFTTLDDQERTLRAGTVLICDGEKPVAIGGIMGGLNSEVNRNTANILLESAYFNPESIQISSRHLGLSTEASQRFGRGADPNGNIYALDRAAQLISEICGGEIYQGIADAYPNPIHQKTIPLRVDQINNLLGTRLSAGEMSDILNRLELIVQDGEVIIPTFRPDLERVADLAEEIARIYGLDNIPAKLQTIINYQIVPNQFDRFIDDLRNLAVGLGFQEVVAQSMINRKKWEDLSGKEVYPIFNPVSKDLDGMRNSLLPSLLQIIQYNMNRQVENLAIFEINRIFLHPDKMDRPPTEDLRMGIALTGTRDGDRWYSSHQSVDLYDIKGTAETLLNKILLDNWEFISYSEAAVAENSLGVQVKGEVIGYLGAISKNFYRSFEFEKNVYLAEFSVSKLFKHRITDRSFRPIPKFPQIERDLALVVDEDLEAGKLLGLIREKGGKNLREAEIFDLYRGKQIEEGKKSVAFRLKFQSPQKTFTEEEINSAVEKILKHAGRTFNAKLRE
jgi:phenylalanyl-tRNA synthetase beta chain